VQVKEQSGPVRLDSNRTLSFDSHQTVSGYFEKILEKDKMQKLYAGSQDTTAQNSAGENPMDN
jgi:hypothetical protein